MNSSSLAWSRVQKMMELRSMTKSRSRISEKQQDFMENLAEYELSKKAEEYLYGDPE